MPPFIRRKILITLLSATSFCTPAQDHNLVVETIYGKIRGAKEKTVEYWTGIPYAQAPVAELRWKSPKKTKNWDNILDTTKPAKDCIQVTNSGTKGQENCLNLNVYRPSNNENELPVLVYIHGGNNQVGTSTEFDPKKIAIRLNAVIVTVNYRLGVLGFNPLKAINTGDKIQDSGNFSLLDIKSSLDWIKRNASVFGGDSNNITAMGFSAGGRDVMAMLISPLFSSSFQKAIVFSGGMTTSDKKTSEYIFARKISNLVVNDGIKKTVNQATDWLLSGDSSVKKYLYSLQADKLASLFGDAGIRMEKFPHLYRDGTVIPINGFDTNNYNSVPILMFSGMSEFSLFAISDPYFKKYFNNGTLNTNTELTNEYNFVNKYGGLLYSLFNVEQSAEKMYKHYHSPIYGAEFSFGMDSFNTGDRMSTVGSFHGVFMPFWDQDKYKKFTADAINLRGSKELSDLFDKYISNFIRNGDPNSKNITNWINWSPKSVEAGESILELGASREKSLIFMRSKSYNSDDVFHAIEKDHTITEKQKKEMVSSILKGRWFSKELDAYFSK